MKPTAGMTGGLKHAAMAAAVAYVTCSHAAQGSTPESADPGASAVSPTLPSVSVRGTRVRDPAWETYRTSFQAMAMFLRSARADEPLEPRFYLRPLRADVPRSDELRLSLSGRGYDREIALDHYWGVLPHDPEAMAANADLTLDAPPGSFALARTLGIRRLPSGNYAQAYLQQGCDRWLAVMRDMHFAYKLRYAFKRCVGAKFLLPAGAQTPVILPDSTAEPALEPFSGNAELNVMTFRFDSSPGREIRVPGPLIAVLPLLE